ncbi:PD40 domain-containing protein [candidate division KSB1 bacterium]|nr:PD40 domain-containing protein [candidate division KSB1 bacterium]
MKRTISILCVLLLVFAVSCIRVKDINAPCSNNELEWGNDLGPQFSPDGQTLYFYSWREGRQDDIYKIRTDGSDFTKLTDNPEDDSMFDISPNGSFLAYVSSYLDRRNIWLMNSDGSNKTRLTYGGMEANPKISPDGSQILFQSYGYDYYGNWKIFTMDVDGQNQVQLTDSFSSDHFPQYSPDGMKICFDSARSGEFEIYIMNTDGSGLVQLTDDEVINREPIFSPDGSQIVFLRSYYGEGSTYVAIIDVDGNNLAELAEGYHGGETDSFSPDGTKLLYSSLGWQEYIYIIDRDGKNKQNLTPELYDSCCPAFSPDGLKIAFCTGAEDEYLRIAIMDADGSNKQILTDFEF